MDEKINTPRARLDERTLAGFSLQRCTYTRSRVVAKIAPARAANEPRAERERATENANQRDARGDQ